MTETKRRGRPKKVKVEAVEEAVMEENIEQEVEPQERFESDNEPFQASSASDFGTAGNFNPYDQDVVEREYATPKTMEGLTDDIPEPDFSSNPSFEDLMNETMGGQAEEEPVRNPFDNPNPALNDLDAKEKQYACEQMVDTVLDVYESLHLIAQNFVKFSEDDLNELIINDEVDPNTVIPVEGGELTLQEFVASYNEQATDVMSYDRAFGHKVRPAMIRVFMKRGWAMTDEQFLLFAIGKDLLTKTTQFIGLKKSMSSTMNLLREMHLENRKQKSSKPSRGRKREPSYQMEEEQNYEFDRQPEQRVQNVEPMHIDNEQDINVGITEKTSYQEFKPVKETELPKEVKQEIDNSGN